MKYARTLRAPSAGQVAVLALLGLHLAACSTRDDEGLNLSQRSQAQTVVNDRVFGFEAPSQDWIPSNSSQVSGTTAAAQGERALSIVPLGYTEIVSVPVPAPGRSLAATTLDLKVPYQLGWGDLRVVVRVPSQGHWWRDLGSVPLVDLAPGAFHRLSFAVPADLRAALDSSASDVEFRIILNGPQGPGAFVLDRLVVSESGTSAAPHEANLMEFSLAIPANMPLESVFVSGTGSTAIDSRCVLAGGLASGSPNPVVAQMGSLGGIALGAASQARVNLWNRGEVVHLSSQTHVFGDVVSAGTVNLQDTSVVVDGSISEHAALDSFEATWIVSWPQGGTDLVRIPDAPAVELQPGAYDSIQLFSRSSVTLRAGEYFVNSLVIEPQVNFEVNTSAGHVLLYVRDVVRSGAPIVHTAGPTGRFLIAYAGRGAAYFEQQLDGTVVAPLGTIDLRNPGIGHAHRGSFFGQNVHINSDAHVEHVVFDWSVFGKCFGPDAPQCRDDQVCYEDSHHEDAFCVTPPTEFAGTTPTPATHWVDVPATLRAKLNAFLQATGRANAVAALLALREEEPVASEATWHEYWHGADRSPMRRLQLSRLLANLGGEYNSNRLRLIATDPENAPEGDDQRGLSAAFAAVGGLYWLHTANSPTAAAELLTVIEQSGGSLRRTAIRTYLQMHSLSAASESRLRSFLPVGEVARELAILRSGRTRP